MKSKAIQKQVDGLWTVGDLRHRFRVTGMTVHLWRTNRGLPAVVIGGGLRPTIRFVPAEVRTWAKSVGLEMYEGTDATGTTNNQSIAPAAA
jgi:hypothetical protein